MSSRQSPTPFGSELIADSVRGKTRQRDRGPPRRYQMRIAPDGTWYHQGSPITRPALVKLFATFLKRHPDGTYWLETPFEHGRIDVDDVPFLAVEMTHVPGTNSTGRDDIVRFRTNLDHVIECGSSHPLRIETDSATQEPRPYVLVRDRLEARLSRPVFYELADLAREGEIDGEKVYGVWSGNRFFRLGPVEPAC